MINQAGKSGKRHEGSVWWSVLRKTSVGSHRFYFKFESSEMQLFCIFYEFVKMLVLYDVINNTNFILINSRSCNE